GIELGAVLGLHTGDYSQDASQGRVEVHAFRIVLGRPLPDGNPLRLRTPGPRRWSPAALVVLPPPSPTPPPPHACPPSPRSRLRHPSCFRCTLSNVTTSRRALLGISATRARPKAIDRAPKLPWPSCRSDTPARGWTDH